MTEPKARGVTVTDDVADLFRNVLAGLQISPGSPTFEQDAAILTKARKQLGLDQAQ